MLAYEAPLPLCTGSHEFQKACLIAGYETVSPFLPTTKILAIRNRRRTTHPRAASHNCAITLLYCAKLNLAITTRHLTSPVPYPASHFTLEGQSGDQVRIDLKLNRSPSQKPDRTAPSPLPRPSPPCLMLAVADDDANSSDVRSHATF